MLYSSLALKLWGLPINVGHSLNLTTQRQKQRSVQRLAAAGLLLTNTVNGSKPVNQVNTADTHDFAGWKQPLQNRQRLRVVWVVKDRH